MILPFFRFDYCIMEVNGNFSEPSGTSVETAREFELPAKVTVLIDTVQSSVRYVSLSVTVFSQSTWLLLNTGFSGVCLVAGIAMNMLVV